MNKKQLTAIKPLSVFKKTQKEMSCPVAENTAFSPYSSLFFSDSPPLMKLFLLFLRKNLNFLSHNKKKLFLVLFLGISSVTLLAYHRLALQEKQEEAAQDLKRLEAQLRRKKKDLLFLKENGANLQAHQYLNPPPTLSRFDVGERLKILSQQAGFQEMIFTVMPEKKIYLQKGNTSAILTKISVSYKTNSDTQLFAWIDSLNDHFSDFLVPRQLSIDRVSTEIQGDGSSFEGVEGIYVFDWIRVEKQIP